MTETEARQFLDKIKTVVPTAEDSANVQKKLLELGYRWTNDVRKVKYTESMFLYTNFPYIHYGESSFLFKESNNKYVKADNIINLNYKKDTNFQFCVRKRAVAYDTYRFSVRAENKEEAINMAKEIFKSGNFSMIPSSHSDLEYDGYSELIGPDNNIITQ